jgi:hypothetical protein
MSPHQIIAVAARLFAVWLAIHVPGNLYEFFEPDSSLNRPSIRWIALCVSIIEVAAMLVLWFFPQTIARKLLTTSTTEPATASSSDTWLRMGCALIGLWVLTTSLPALILDASVLYSAHIDDTSSLRHSVLYYLAEVAISVWLILGARGFREIYWWASNAGISKHSNS